MIYVNIRAIIERKSQNNVEVLVQTRNRDGEPNWYEFPGGQIEEFESITDALKREVKEETGLTVSFIDNEEESIALNEDKSSFSTQCIKPYCIYQTTKGPIDSFGAYFRCSASGEINNYGDDAKNPKWVTPEELREIVYTPGLFSDIDKSTAMMYLQDIKE